MIEILKDEDQGTSLMLFQVSIVFHEEQNKHEELTMNFLCVV